MAKDKDQERQRGALEQAQNPEKESFLSQRSNDLFKTLLGVGIDTLVLGCTHYPLLTGVISYVCGDDVTLVSSAEETAKDVYRTLTRHGLGRPAGSSAPVHRFLATGDPEPFARLGRRFLGPEVTAVERTPEWVAGP